MHYSFQMNQISLSNLAMVMTTYLTYNESTILLGLVGYSDIPLCQVYSGISDNT